MLREIPMEKKINTYKIFFPAKFIFEYFSSRRDWNKNGINLKFEKQKKWGWPRLLLEYDLNFPSFASSE